MIPGDHDDSVVASAALSGMSRDDALSLVTKKACLA